MGQTNEEKTIRTLLDEIIAEMCDNYCKYPLQPIPEGKTEDWLFDADSPCNNCPLNKIG